MTTDARPAEETPTWESAREERKLFRSRFPEAGAVLTGLRQVLSTGGRLVAIEREPNEWRSTFPSEVVTCRFDDGRVERVLCKYGLTDYASGHGHRGGVPREALVYRRVLNPLGFRPRCFGTYSNGDGETWLVLEYIEGVPRLELAEEGIPVLSRAAGWSGRFHAATEGAQARAAEEFLSTYDAAYYAGWCERTVAYAGDWHREFPWLRTFCQRFARAASEMLGGNEVVVHGEYTPHNVILREPEAFPVDWESAAVGAGEIDLASLTDQWPAGLVADAIAAYAAERWPDGAPAAFETRLLAARSYWTLRWLGNRIDQTAREKSGPRFELLREYGQQLGLL
jgi:hypothetical protein